MNTVLFNSTTQPVPPIRRDVQVIPVEDNGRNLLLFHDPMKIAVSGFALDRSVEPILSLIDGYKSLDQLIPYFADGVSTNQLLKFIRMLDEQKILESDHFRMHYERIEAEFEDADIRQPALANSSYPADEENLDHFMQDLMSHCDGDSVSKTPGKALYAPHIDLRVGSRQYAEAFNTIKDIQPKRVVVLATAHYSGYHPDIYDGFPFIGSIKDYQLPGRILKTDRTSIKHLEKKGTETGFTIRDRAHRIEHSIETHLLFASYIWKHDFTIVPILVAGINEIFYKADGDIGQKIERFSSQLQQLDTDDTFYLISGDLSHVGKKFGDTIPAGVMRKDVEKFDREFIRNATESNLKNLLTQLSAGYDPYRICGFPPLYTFLKTFPEQRGIPINYHWWDESERESAVSFGSIAF